MNKNLFKYIEKTLYTYKKIPLMLKNKKYELETVMPKASSSVVKLDHNAKRNKDTTQYWAIKRTEGKLSKEIEHLEWFYSSITELLEVVKKEEKIFMDLKYNKELDRGDIMMKLGCGESKFSDIRKEFIEDVAQCLGQRVWELSSIFR